jgi:hypothetical protein
MKKRNILISVFAIASLILLINESFAQGRMQWRGSGGWGMGSKYGRMYNPKTVETINGDVISVDRITPRKEMRYGIHLMVKTDKEEISVHLGPGWYIENQEISIEPKDKISVKGSRITINGNSAIVAAEIMKGDEILKLRDESGFPVWSGWRGRRR